VTRKDERSLSLYLVVMRNPEGSPDDGRQRRFEYIQGVFLTQYGGFVATLLASFAWFAVLWTQKLPQGFIAKVALCAATLVLNALIIYFLTQVTLYSRVLLRFVPDEANQEIREVVDSTSLDLGLRLAVWVRKHSVIRKRAGPGKTVSPPYLWFGLALVGSLAVLEIIRLVCK